MVHPSRNGVYLQVELRPPESGGMPGSGVSGKTILLSWEAIWMKVLIAIDSFKGCMSSKEAGRACAEGIWID